MSFMSAIGRAIRAALRAMRTSLVWVMEKGEWVLKSIVGSPEPIAPEPPMDIPSLGESTTASVADQVAQTAAASPAATLLRYARATPITRHAMKLDPSVRTWLEGIDDRVLHEVAKGGMTAADRVVAQATLQMQLRDPADEARDRLKAKYGSRIREIAGEPEEAWALA